MSTKWLNKLTKDELIELHEYVFGKGLVNDLEVLNDDNFDSEFISITVKENGWKGDDDKDETIDTNYELEDFDGYTIIDWAGSGNDKYYKIDFRMWMINRFGTEYVDELVKETLGLNLINYLDWSK